MAMQTSRKRLREDDDLVNDDNIQRVVSAAAAYADSNSMQYSASLNNADCYPQQSAGSNDADDARRERIRLAARERQRKYRRRLKERELQSLGMPLLPSEDVQFEPLIPTNIADPVNAESMPAFPFDATRPHDGQTFATTLLLSFACTPLLKQNLLRILNMTSEDLLSLEPVIADAWNQWDIQRKIRSSVENGRVASFEGLSTSTGSTGSSAFENAIDPNLDGSAPSKKL